MGDELFAPRAHVAPKIERAWAGMRAQAAMHGRRWREHLGPGRARLIRRVLRDYPDDPHVLEKAVKGYYFRALGWSDEFREKCWNPEYILRADKLDVHLDAWFEAAGAKEFVSAAPPPDVEKAQATAAVATARGQFGRVSKA